MVELPIFLNKFLFPQNYQGFQLTSIFFQVFYAEMLALMASAFTLIYSKKQIQVIYIRKYNYGEFRQHLNFAMRFPVFQMTCILKFGHPIFIEATSYTLEDCIFCCLLFPQHQLGVVTYLCRKQRSIFRRRNKSYFLFGGPNRLGNPFFLV